MGRLSSSRIDSTTPKSFTWLPLEAMKGKWPVHVSECAGIGSPWRPATALSGVDHPSQSGVALSLPAALPHMCLFHDSSAPRQSGAFSELDARGNRHARQAFFIQKGAVPNQSKVPPSIKPLTNPWSVSVWVINKVGGTMTRARATIPRGNKMAFMGSWDFGVQARAGADLAKTLLRTM